MPHRSHGIVKPTGIVTRHWGVFYSPRLYRCLCDEGAESDKGRRRQFGSGLGGVTLQEEQISDLAPRDVTPGVLLQIGQPATTGLRVAQLAETAMPYLHKDPPTGPRAPCATKTPPRCGGAFMGLLILREEDRMAAALSQRSSVHAP